jgi:hypothetical protein
VEFFGQKDLHGVDDTMAKPSMDLSASIGKLLEEQDGDLLREGIRVPAQALMEIEVAGLLGAERHERTDDRTGYRNGSRVRTWDTRVGTIQLEIPKVRPRRRCSNRGGVPSTPCSRWCKRRTCTASRRGQWTS